MSETRAKKEAAPGVVGRDDIQRIKMDLWRIKTALRELLEYVQKQDAEMRRPAFEYAISELKEWDEE